MLLLLVGEDGLCKRLTMGLLPANLVLELYIQQVLTTFALQHNIHTVDFLIPSGIAKIAVAKLFLVFLLFTVHKAGYYICIT